MNRTLRRAIATTAALGLAVSTSGVSLAQESPGVTPEGLLDRAARAAWGETPDALWSYRRTMEVDLVEQGISMKIVVEALAPDRIRTSIEIPGLEDQVRGFDGRVGWVRDSGSTPSALEGDDLARIARQARFRAVLDWRDLWSEATAIGRKPIDGVEIELVRLTGKTGGSVVQGFDRRNDRLVYEEVPLDASPDGETIRIRYEDHRPVAADGPLAGISISRTHRIIGPNGPMVAKVVGFEPNIEIDLSRFAMPAK